MLASVSGIYECAVMVLVACVSLQSRLSSTANDFVKKNKLTINVSVTYKEYIQYSIDYTYNSIVYSFNTKTFTL